VKVGIATHQSLLEARRIGLEGLARTPGVEAEPPPFARVEAFGSSYMEMNLFGWVDQTKADWWKVRSEAVRHLKGAFEQGGIELPPPSLQLETTRVPELPNEQREGTRTAAGAPTEDLTQQAHEVGQDVHLQRQMDREQLRAGEEDLLCDDGSERKVGPR
jgi:small-conductance mechanosensitive channel